MGEIETTALGFVRFRLPIMQRNPTVLSGIIEAHRRWDGLDSMIVAELHRHGEQEHVHLPSVEHLHEYTSPPHRRRELTKLRYIGDGRYLNGVPADDFETWDAEQVAVCVDSGLYTVIAPPQRERPPMNKMDEPEKTTAFIPFTTFTPNAEKEI